MKVIPVRSRVDDVEPESVKLSTVGGVVSPGEISPPLQSSVSDTSQRYTPGRPDAIAALLQVLGRTVPLTDAVSIVPTTDSLSISPMLRE